VSLNAADGHHGEYTPTLNGTGARAFEDQAHAVTFRTYPRPETHSLSPAVGPITGGTFLTLVGRGFDAFGELPTQPVVHVTAVEISGQYLGYVVNGILNHRLHLRRGLTYRFDVNAVGHPLIISTISGGGRMAGELLEADGVRNSRVEVGSLYFTPGARTPTALFYQDMGAPAPVAESLEAAEAKGQTITILDATGGVSARIGSRRTTPLARNLNDLLW
jgi:hypothetical protein